MKGKTIVRDKDALSEEEAIPNDSSGNGEPRLDLGRRFLNLKTLVSFAVAFAFLFFLVRQTNLDVSDVVSHISRANPVLYLLALAVYYSSFLVRGARWKLLLDNVGPDTSTGRPLPSIFGLSEIMFLSWFANCIMPAKLGDAYRAYLLNRNSGVSFPRTFGTVLAERIVDLLLCFVLLAIVGLLAFRGSLPPEIMLVIQASMVLVVVVTVGLLAMRNLGPLIRRALPARFHWHYGAFEEGTLGSFRQLPLVLAYSLVTWLIEAARLYLVILALGLVVVSIPLVMLITVAAALLASLPGTPAGFGVVEGGIVVILMLAGRLGMAPGMDQGMAASVAILDRTISYWSLVLFGFIGYMLTRKR